LVYIRQLLSSRAKDISQRKLPGIQTVVVPKVHSTKDLDILQDAFASTSHATGESLSAYHTHMNIVASIESAGALWDIETIAKWDRSHGDLRMSVSALLVRALLFYLLQFQLALIVRRRRL
jgi:citrate lyase beta subunit